tara:strand:- start:4377 stop:4766 length:390 start_codon:yes stop_codon:yes gene_type:complete
MNMVRPTKVRNNFLNNNAGRNDGSGIGLIEGFTKGTTYGTGTKMQKQIEEGGKLPSDTKLFTAAKNIPTKTKPQIEAFGPTEFGQEPVTSGMPIGPGPGPTTATKYNFDDFVYQSWIESGDDSLLQYII